MSQELDQLLKTLEPATPENLQLRLRFGLICVRRVEHLIEQPEVLDCLAALDQAVSTMSPLSPSWIDKAQTLANQHVGSKSIDGVGHAAVSATYACAKAVAGQVRQAAEYAAYAAVYGQGGYGATSDPSSFTPEKAWQAQQLRELLS